MSLPKVVIVGRPNVGKSSLFNWLAQRKIAIIDNVAGGTRDRVGALLQIGKEELHHYCELMDTGGVGMVDRDDLSDEVDHQIDAAMNEADLILFVVDVREGVMPLDEEVAKRLRALDKPIILVANKSDIPTLDYSATGFEKLGRNTSIFISVHQNRNKQALLDLIDEKLADKAGEKPKDAVMKVAVVGRPNTGKSTFINTLLQDDRMIVSEIAGTTRDAVDVRFEIDGLPFMAIDTAGVRRKAKIRDDLDFYSIHRAERSIRRADVVFLFLDPMQGISRLDKQLADYIVKQYKPCIFVVNKWDLMRAEAETDEPAVDQMNNYAIAMQHQFRTMTYAPIAFITAKTGKNVKALLNLAQSMYKQANKRIGTGALNRIVHDAIIAHAPPMRENQVAKIYFATQIEVDPPTIVLFVNRPSLFDAPYLRYLLKVFREKLPFRDIPVKLYLRARVQTDPSKRRIRSDKTDPVDRPGSVPLGGNYEGDLETDYDREVSDFVSELDD